MELIDQLKRDEGLRLKLYQDIKGIWSIGYGLNLEQGITQEEAEWLLQSRIDVAKKSADANFPWLQTLSPARRDVIYNMTYNMGISRLKGFVHMLAAAKAHDYKEAEAEILDSSAARELPERYGRLADIMGNG